MIVKFLVVHGSAVALRACHLPLPSRAPSATLRAPSEIHATSVNRLPLRFLQPRAPSFDGADPHPRIPPADPPPSNQAATASLKPCTPSFDGADPPPSNQAAAASFHPRIEQLWLPSMALLPSTASPAAAPLESRPRIPHPRIKQRQHP
jgi:hypothetical protein